MMDRAELSARLTLRALPGLRDLAINRLIREHGSAVAALHESAQLVDVGARTLPDHRVAARVAACMETIDRLGIDVIAVGDPRYPRRLRQRLDRSEPSILFALGNVGLLDDAGIAIVGSRAMSEYGRTVCEDFTRVLTAAGVTVISGLAAGIDAVAHASSLRAGGDTIAVVGCGVDVTYPSANRELRQAIIARGLLISQFLPGERPAPHHFPERNLLLAALSEGVLVVEAGARSGASITATHAGDVSVDLMVVPSAVGRPAGMGSNQLLREGAVCVTCPAEVLETIGDRIANQLAAQRERRQGRAAKRARGVPHAAVDPAADAIRSVLADGPRHLDDIIAATRMPTDVVMKELVKLELAGAVRQHPGTRFEACTGVAG